MSISSQLITNNYQPECASNKQQTINNRLYDRNIPSQMLQPYLNVRPAITKYTIMPIVEPRGHSNVAMNQLPVYNSNNVFNPGNTKSPWSGYASAINTESELRNQIYALQKCSQAVYVPNSGSDLYEYSFKSTQTSANVQQPFQGLFKNEHFNTFNPNTENIGNNAFNNCTRQQIRNLTNKPKSHCTEYGN